MTQITLRGLDPQLEQEIRRRAKESGKSLNRLILDIIYHSMGAGKKGGRKTAAASLKKLAGGWSNEDAEVFLRSIQACEQIDEEMWG